MNETFGWVATYDEHNRDICNLISWKPWHTLTDWLIEWGHPEVSFPYLFKLMNEYCISSSPIGWISGSSKCSIQTYPWVTVCRIIAHDRKNFSRIRTPFQGGSISSGVTEECHWQSAHIFACGKARGSRDHNHSPGMISLFRCKVILQRSFREPTKLIAVNFNLLYPVEHINWVGGCRHCRRL